MATNYKMNEKVKKVFELIGVEPNEMFYVINTGTNKEDKNKYYLSGSLLLYCETEKQTIPSSYSIRDIIIGYIKIKKIKTWTAKEKVFAKYWQELGFKYVARDETDILEVYKEKPTKDEDDYCWTTNLRDGCYENNLEHEQILGLDFPNVKWSDREPTLLEDIIKS